MFFNFLTAGVQPASNVILEPGSTYTAVAPQTAGFVEVALGRVRINGQVHEKGDVVCFNAGDPRVCGCINSSHSRVIRDRSVSIEPHGGVVVLICGSFRFESDQSWLSPSC